MKARIKAALKARLGPLVARRARAYSQRLEREWGCTAITQQILERFGPVVQAGPFAGLEFPPSTFERHIGPKLLGAYESELTPFWDELLERDYPEVVDVGSAEGYYAVGMAMRLPGATVHAFDIDGWARRVTREMAARNGVENLVVRGKCSPAWLGRHLKPGSFVLSDCEGYEDVLLDPREAPALTSCDMLVELHEGPAPGVTGRLIERFEGTHRHTLIDAAEHRPEEFLPDGFLTERDRGLAVSDIRTPGQQWLLLERGA